MDTKTKYLCIIICPKKFKFAHNVFEVTELCPSRADILKPRSDTSSFAEHLNVNKVLNVEVLALISPEYP